MSILRPYLNFVLVLGAQWLFLQGMQFSIYGNPYFYMLFLLWLPSNTKAAALYTYAFVLGFAMDGFEQSGGAHTIATLLMAAAKPVVERGLVGFTGNNELESFRELDVRRFIIPTIILVFIHHTVLFSLENYGFELLKALLLRIVLSTTTSVASLLVLHMLFKRK